PSVVLRADGILEGVAEQHRYQLQNDAANRLIGALLDAASVPTDRRVWFQQLLTTVMKLHEDGTSTGDIKVTNAALKELRYGYKVFAPYGGVRKVTVFGSPTIRRPNSRAASIASSPSGVRASSAGGWSA